MGRLVRTEGLTDEQEEILKVVRQFVEKEILPVATELEHADEYPTDIVEGLKELGIFGLMIPEEYGGLGESLLTYALVVEEIARGWMSVSGVINTHFIVAYMLILLPFLLFSGATALSGMLALPAKLGISPEATIWLVVAFIAVIGSAYAIFGGLRAVAVSDTFNGAGLLIGGVMITVFTLKFIGGEEGGIFGAFSTIKEANPDAFVSIPKEGDQVIND